jgi:hypothetical protein
MSIISKQTGYSNDSNLLYAILKEVDDICKALGPTPTTTTTTTLNPGLTMAVANNARFDIPQQGFGNESDFTIEWGAKLSDWNGHPRAWSIGSSPSAAHAVSIEGGSFYYRIDQILEFGADVSDYNIIGNWVYFTIMRKEDNIYIFINGVEISGGVQITSAIPTNGYPLYIGSEGNDSVMNTLMSNFRWTSSALYPIAGFTTPSAPLTALEGTQLLLFQGNSLSLELTDNSGVSFPTNVISNATGVYNAESPFGNPYEGSIQFGTV